MITTESACVGCPDELGCTGAACAYSEVTRCFCDKCGRELQLYDRTRYQAIGDILYITDVDDERCIDCAFDLYIKPEGVPAETMCECCGDEYYADELRDVDGFRLCKSCVAKRLRKAGAAVWI